MNVRLLIVMTAGIALAGVRDCRAELRMEGMRVTQKRGVVCITDECIVYRDASKGADHCWVPDSETAVGVVTKVEKTHVIVEYATDEGWTAYRVTEEPTVVWAVDYWGDPVVFVRKKDKMEFRREDSGRLLSGEDPPGKLKLPIRVRCPIDNVSIPPPKFDDVVVRGPDWNKGSADGQAGWRGRIVQRSPDDVNPRGSDGYVTVEWEGTKRRGRYRWDYHRKFDVIAIRKEPAKAD
jgi:hypothetical protein